ncbi:hypothetical protein MKW98_007636 [Papaver atlanticum]|uniref:Peroxidase n=1 Tax=Papaver atlanticum TaxID=357466 RepID=A0AAD4X7G9_9MAGN|nr:hypothetical protein MKW98_007636 [Papaver atlanticum]
MSKPFISSSSFFLCLLIIVTISIAAECSKKPNKDAKATTGGGHELKVDYYSKSCPKVENLISSVTTEMFNTAPITAPSTIRLFFHDCFVDGCDASVLITSKPGSGDLAELDAQVNKNFANEAFVSIQKAKTLVESKCPGVVSCADILAISARNFVNLTGGPHYEVKKGRWDGKISMATRATSNIPRPNNTVDELINLFGSKGLGLEDLVALSGAHTIGFAHCKSFLHRLYDHQGTNKPDPSIDPRLLKALRTSCPRSGGSNNVVAPFDVTTPFTFDYEYYRNLEAKLGILPTDQALFTDPRTRPIVMELGRDNKKFHKAFAKAMEKMGSIGVKRGKKHGEKRKDCSQHVIR